MTTPETTTATEIDRTSIARSIFGADHLFRVANTKNWAGYEVRIVSFESHGWGTSASTCLIEAVKRNGNDITGGKTYGKTYRVRASKLFPSNL